jgi:hypothetical protein
MPQRSFAERRPRSSVTSSPRNGNYEYGQEGEEVIECGPDERDHAAERAYACNDG